MGGSTRRKTRMFGFSLKGFCKVHKSKRVCEIRINVAKHKKEEENKNKIKNKKRGSILQREKREYKSMPHKFSQKEKEKKWSECVS